MQTLQRLAKFDNPMQELARTRFSEYSLMKSHITGLSRAKTTGESYLETSIIRERQTVRPQSTDLNITKKGKQESGYQFPPLGLTSSPASQLNPVYGATHIITSAPSRPPGYPQPLTAGPPGQRQYLGGPSKVNNNYMEHMWVREARSPTNHSFGNPEVTSPWSCTNTSKPAASQPEAANPYVIDDPTKPFETLPLDDVAKYYPNGFPSVSHLEFVPTDNSDRRTGHGRKLYPTSS